MNWFRRNTKSRALHTGRLPWLLLSMVALVLSLVMAACGDILNPPKECDYPEVLGTVLKVDPAGSSSAGTFTGFFGSVSLESGNCIGSGNIKVDKGRKVWINLVNGAQLSIEDDLTDQVNYARVVLSAEGFIVDKGRATYDTGMGTNPGPFTGGTAYFVTITGGTKYGIISATRDYVFVGEGTVSVVSTDNAWRVDLEANDFLTVIGNQEPEPPVTLDSVLTAALFEGSPLPDSLR